MNHLDAHLDALRFRLSNERMRLANAKNKNERTLRAVWVAQIEREIASAIAFQGKADDLPEMSDDDLLAELGA